jgi:hypothetical protein
MWPWRRREKEEAQAAKQQSIDDREEVDYIVEELRKEATVNNFQIRVHKALRGF